MISLNFNYDDYKPKKMTFLGHFVKNILSVIFKKFVTCDNFIKQSIFMGKFYYDTLSKIWFFLSFESDIKLKIYI